MNTILILSEDGIYLLLWNKLRTEMYISLDAKGRSNFQKSPAISRSVMVGVSVLILLALIPLYVSKKNESSVPNNITQTYSNFALTVINWGPQSAEVGAIPNIQPDGSMGVWIQVSDTQGFGDAQVTFGGEPVKTCVQDKLITVAIPIEQLSHSGHKEVLIKQIATGRVFTVGTFNIEKTK